MHTVIFCESHGEFGNDNLDAYTKLSKFMSERKRRSAPDREYARFILEKAEWLIHNGYPIFYEETTNLPAPGVFSSFSVQKTYDEYKRVGIKRSLEEIKYQIHRSLNFRPWVWYTLLPTDEDYTLYKICFQNHNYWRCL